MSAVTAGRRMAMPLLVLAIAVSLTTLLRHDFTVGSVEAVRWTSDGGRAVALVHTVAGIRPLLLDRALGQRLPETAWLVARGTPRHIEGYAVLDVRRLATINGVVVMDVLDAHGSADPLAAAARHPAVGILSAVVLLLMGVFAVRAAGCITMGFAGALVVWQAMAVARIDEWIPHLPASGPAALVIGFL